MHRKIKIRGYGLSNEALTRLFKNINKEKFLSSNKALFDNIDFALSEHEVGMDFRMKNILQYMDFLSHAPFYSTFPIVRIYYTRGKPYIFVPEFNLASLSEAESRSILQFLKDDGNRVEVQSAITKTLCEIVGAGLPCEVIAQFVSENAETIEAPYDKEAMEHYDSVEYQMAAVISDAKNKIEKLGADNIVPFPGRK